MIYPIRTHSWTLTCYSCERATFWFYFFVTWFLSLMDAKYERKLLYLLPSFVHGAHFTRESLCKKSLKMYWKQSSEMSQVCKCIYKNKYLTMQNTIQWQTDGFHFGISCVLIAIPITYFLWDQFKVQLVRSPD